MAKAAFNKKRALFTSTLDLELRKKLVKCYIWNIAVYGADTWTLRAVDEKHLENFEMWCWRRMEKMSWTDHVRNEKVLVRVEEQRNILHEISKRKVNWIGHILRRNCLLQRDFWGTIEGGIEVTERRGLRRRKLLDVLKERRGYFHLKEESLDRTMWRARFGRGFGPVVRQTTEWMNEYHLSLQALLSFLFVLSNDVCLKIQILKSSFLSFVKFMAFPGSYVQFVFSPSCSQTWKSYTLPIGSEKDSTYIKFIYNI